MQAQGGPQGSSFRATTHPMPGTAGEAGFLGLSPSVSWKGQTETGTHSPSKASHPGREVQQSPDPSPRGDRGDLSGPCAKNSDSFPAAVLTFWGPRIPVLFVPSESVKGHRFSSLAWEQVPGSPTPRVWFGWPSRHSYLSRATPCMFPAPQPCPASDCHCPSLPGTLRPGPAPPALPSAAHKCRAHTGSKPSEWTVRFPPTDPECGRWGRPCQGQEAASSAAVGVTGRKRAAPRWFLGPGGS